MIRLVRRFSRRRNMSSSRIHCCYIVVGTEFKEKHILEQDELFCCGIISSSLCQGCRREGGRRKKYQFTMRNLEVHLIGDQSSSAPGLHPLLHPNFHSLRFSRTHSRDAGEYPYQTLCPQLHVLLNKNRSYLLQNCNICRDYVLF